MSAPLYSTDPGSWLEYAREDLRAAETLLDAPDCLPRYACFWAHESAQKAIKSALVRNQVAFDYRSEDLHSLLEQLPDSEELRQYLGQAEAFSDHDMWVLYPSDRTPPTEDDARSGVIFTRAILSSAERRVQQPDP
jgi:HEPN domain-containing protein